MDYTLLARAPIFKGLTPEEAERSIGSVVCRTRFFRSGSMIAQSGEPVESFLLVLSGLVKGEMVDATGRIIKIEEIPSAGALAPAFIFGNSNRFPVNVIAVSDSEILIIEKLEFLKLLTGSNKLLVNFLDMLSNRSQFLSDKIKFLNFKTIKVKLSQFILDKSAGTDRVNLGMTQNELADYFGVARPSVARVLGDLEEEGIIAATGRQIMILRKDRLTLLAAD